jgi:hypothetical protein
VFDPDKGLPPGLDDDDDDLLEVLANDSAENFFDLMQHGIGFRFLGTGFVLKGATGFGSKVDAFEASFPVAARKDQGTSAKHFLFDSGTGLLARISYAKKISNTVIPVVTEWGAYASVAGNQLPGSIARKHSQQGKFQVAVSGSEFAAAANDKLFG